MAALESRYYLHAGLTGDPMNFAEQYLVDCFRNAYCSGTPVAEQCGCYGGWMKFSYEWIKANGNTVPSTSQYGYTSGNGS